MASDSTSGKNSRLYLLGAILVLWCVAICGRLVFLQIFSYGKFVKLAGHQQQRAIPLSPKRGDIYDRSGNELAMSVQVDSAFAVPSEVKDLPTAVSLISRMAGDDPNVVLADCRAHKTFCWVARKADDETIEPHQIAEPAGHSFSEGAETLLSSARFSRAGAGLGGYGRFRAERHRTRI